MFRHSDLRACVYLRWPRSMRRVAARTMADEARRLSSRRRPPPASTSRAGDSERLQNLATRCGREQTGRQNVIGAQRADTSAPDGTTYITRRLPRFINAKVQVAAVRPRKDSCRSAGGAASFCHRGEHGSGGEKTKASSRSQANPGKISMATEGSKTSWADGDSSRRRPCDI